MLILKFKTLDCVTTMLSFAFSKKMCEHIPRNLLIYPGVHVIKTSF